MATILVVEDDKNMRRLIDENLERCYSVVSADNGLSALSIVETQHIDLIVADIMMPQLNGYELVRELRNSGNNIPVIMATAKHDFNDKRDGFFVGANDYMIKPINFDELIWRIDSLLKLAKISADREIVIGRFRLNAASYEAFYDKDTIEMTRKEFDLIFKLLSYPNRLFSSEKLLYDIWGYDCPSDDGTIRTHMNRLRNKLVAITEFEIKTVRGIGYKAVIHEKK